LIVGGFFGAALSTIGGMETGRGVDAAMDPGAGAGAGLTSGAAAPAAGPAAAAATFTGEVLRRTKNTGSRGAAASEEAGGFSSGEADAGGGVLGVGGVATGAAGAAGTSGCRGLALKKMSGQGISIRTEK
jgi:hypothetical protein